MIHLRLHQSFHWRLVLLVIFFVALLGAVGGRLFTLSIVEHRRFTLAAERQHNLLQILPSTRGAIFFQDKDGSLEPAAIQRTFFALVAIPREIKDPEGTAKALAVLLKVPEAELLAKLAKDDDPYEVLARKLEPGLADTIQALGLDGLALVEESRRIYPQGELAASVIGFSSFDDSGERGEYGIERHYDSRLAGEKGFFAGVRDAAGSWVSLGKRILNPPLDGDAVVLTLDSAIQFQIESALSSLTERWQASSGLGLVLEPKTGRILALSSRPSFDPNEYSREKDFSVFRMPAVDSQFELGSAFKPITLALAVDAGAVTAATTYEDPGQVRFGSYTISNFDGRAHGVQTMTQVLEKSLNTGAVFAVKRLGQERFLEGIERFGFGRKTGIDFPGEVAGDVSHLAQRRDVDYATASFGQGIAVTPLQLASAVGAIANGGVLMRPYLVEKFIDPNGLEEVRRPQEVRRVMSPAAAEEVTKMLVSVVRNGFDKRAGVDGYFVAAKTGTAQIPYSDRRGYSEEVIHTFVGYAPAFDPKFLILLQLNRPVGNRFAANTLSPAFRELTEFLLQYYEVPPDEPRRSAL